MKPLTDLLSGPPSCRRPWASRCFKRRPEEKEPTAHMRFQRRALAWLNQESTKCALGADSTVEAASAIRSYWQDWLVQVTSHANQRGTNFHDWGVASWSNSRMSIMRNDLDAEFPQHAHLWQPSWLCKLYALSWNSPNPVPGAPLKALGTAARHR